MERIGTVFGVTCNEESGEWTLRVRLKHKERAWFLRLHVSEDEARAWGRRIGCDVVLDIHTRETGGSP